MKSKKQNKIMGKIIFEIAIFKKGDVFYSVCPQLGLVLSDDDNELVEYSMRSEIKNFLNHPKRDKIFIPKLRQEMAAEFEQVKESCLKRKIPTKQYLRISPNMLCTCN